jgi:hypothetical protein
LSYERWFSWDTVERPRVNDRTIVAEATGIPERQHDRTLDGQGAGEPHNERV